MSAGHVAPRSFVAPMTYIQGPGVLDDIGAIVGERHRRVLVLVDPFVSSRFGPRLTHSLDLADVEADVVTFSGEVTAGRIAALVDASRGTGATAVVAVGGGKTLDTGKGVAKGLDIALVTVPTVASNDGPTSRVIALYDDAHRLIATPRTSLGPQAVVVDTEVIATAPLPFLLSGIGDAMAKEFEVAACLRGTGTTSNGGRPLQLPTAIAELCRRTLMTESPAAVDAVRAGRPNDALEHVVEAVVLMSGLAFENGGLSLAHSMTRGLMRVAGHALHGYHVAYGLLVQLEHEGRRAEFAETHELFGRLGLPRCLADLDAPADEATVDVIVDATLDAPHMLNCVPTPTRTSLVRAMRVVESAR